MADIATHFPPQTYSSSFFLNSLTDDDKNAAGECNKDAVDKRTENTPLLDCFISTMLLHSSKLILTVLLYSVVSTCEAFECYSANQPVTRIFSDLTKYQANKIPFSAVLPQSQGNYVEFSVKTIPRLPKNALIAFDSTQIHKLSLRNKQIETIEEGAFVSLFCLQMLDLSHNNIRALERDVFQELFQLEMLDLSENLLEELPDYLFSVTTNLRVLNLANNRIEILHDLCFSNLSALEELNLKHNQLKNIQPEVLLPLTHLKSLNLDSNQLGNIEPENWRGLSKLETLNLANNSLFRFETGYKLPFNNLKTLNLSGNELTELNVPGIREYLPRLFLIDLNDNPWSCQDLAIIVHGFADYKIIYPGRNFTTVNYHGIACRNVSNNHSPPTVPSATGSPNLDTASKNYFDEILVTNKKITMSNIEIMEALRYIQNLLLVLFIFVLFFVMFEILVRYNVCRIIFNRFNWFNRFTNSDNSSEVEVEAFGLVEN